MVNSFPSGPQERLARVLTVGEVTFIDATILTGLRQACVWCFVLGAEPRDGRVESFSRHVVYIRCMQNEVQDLLRICLVEVLRVAREGAVRDGVKAQRG